MEENFDDYRQESGIDPECGPGIVLGCSLSGTPGRWCFSIAARQRAQCLCTCSATVSLHLLSSADYPQASEDNELLDCLCCCFRDTVEVFARDKQRLGKQGRVSGSQTGTRLAACDTATRRPTNGRGQSDTTPGASPGLSKDVTGTGGSKDTREGAGTDSKELFFNPLKVSCAKENNPQVARDSPVLHRATEVPWPGGVGSDALDRSHARRSVILRRAAGIQQAAALFFPSKAVPVLAKIRCCCCKLSKSGKAGDRPGHSIGAFRAPHEDGQVHSIDHGMAAHRRRRSSSMHPLHIRTCPALLAPARVDRLPGPRTRPIPPPSLASATAVPLCPARRGAAEGSLGSPSRPPGAGPGAHDTQSRPSRPAGPLRP